MRVSKITRFEPTEPAAAATTPEIAVVGVSKRYGRGADAVQAVAEVTLSVAHNEFVSVLGPSGCGKSTLLMMLAGLVKPSEGTIQIKGEDVAGPRRDNGIVFQHSVLLPWRTVLDNVLLPIEMMQEDVRRYLPRAHELLEIAGIIDFKDRLPRELSGGMRQRAGICRALIHGPSVLLMDEPFSALDALTRDEMNLELLDIWERDRKTVVFVTHSISEAIFLSDRVAVMSRRPGRIIEDIAIALPRPRQIDMQETPRFTELRARVRRLITH
jgi:NitT/TauT family transport system ATP-binding protein